MKKEKLEELRQKAQVEFDSLAKRSNELEDEIKRVNEELSRLQGEYRILTQLIEDYVISPDAATIDVDAALAQSQEGEIING